MNKNYRKEYLKQFHQMSVEYSERVKKSHEQKWTEQSQDVYFKRLENILPDKNNISQAQKELLSEIITTINNVSSIFEVLDKYQLNYEIGIAGGALRDMILNNCEKIGDFDIIFSIEDKYNSVNNIKSLGYHNQIELTKTDEKGTININKKALNNLIINFINKKFTDTETFLDKDTVEQIYLTNCINSIVKIPKNNEFSRPIDLIISKYNTNIFTQNFNFEICKAFITFDQNELKRLKEDTKNLTSTQLMEYSTNLLDKLMVMHSFVNDVENKTFSLDIAKFTVEHVEYFMNKHYIKLQERYPEYKKNFFVSDKFRELMAAKGQIEILEDKLKNKEILQLHYRLEDNLPMKPEKIIKKKI